MLVPMRKLTGLVRSSLRTRSTPCCLMIAAVVLAGCQTPTGERSRPSEPSSANTVSSIATTGKQSHDTVSREHSPNDSAVVNADKLIWW